MKLSPATSLYGLTGLLCALGASQAGLAWWYAHSDAPLRGNPAPTQLIAAQPDSDLREMLAILGLLGILASGGAGALLVRRRVELPLAKLQKTIAHLAARAPADPGLDAPRADMEAMARGLEDLRTLLANALQAENALRDSDCALLMTDADFRITAINPRGEALLQTRTPDLRKAVPDFDPRQLIGKSIDGIFPQTQRDKGKIIAAEAAQTRALQIGAAEFEISVWPVRDPGAKGGEALQGFMLRIQDRTAQNHAEREILANAEALTRGELTQRISLEGKTGIARSLADALNTISARFDALVCEARTVLAAQAQRDLSVQMHGTYEGAFAELSTHINAAAHSMAQTVSGLQDHAAKLRSVTREIQDGAGDLAERTNHQASTLQETAAATEELSRTVADNAARAEQARTSAASAQGNVDQSAEVARSATQAMNQIVDSSRRISEIISLIDDIAFQTNLLALNASVEAARAGDAGKGFAVVASEVRRLAQSAAQASAEVKTLIQSSSLNVRTGVDLVERSASSLRRIEADVRDLSSFMEAIADATREQAQGLRQVHVAVTQMDEITQKNSTLADATNAAVARADRQTRDLDATVAGFRLAQGLPNRGRDFASEHAPIPEAKAPAGRAQLSQAPAAPRGPSPRLTPNAPLPADDAPARKSPARDLQVRVRRSVTAASASPAKGQPAAPPRAEDDWSEF